MKANFLALAVAICFIGVLSQLATQAEEPEKPADKPIPPGNYWYLPDSTYVYRSGESTREIVVGQDALTFPEAQGSPGRRYRVDGDLIALQQEEHSWGPDYATAYQTTIFDPPIPVMSRSPRLHQTIRWRTTVTERGPDDGVYEASGSISFVGLETVTVPRGTFQALRVDTVYHGSRNDTRLGTEWYAAGVGLVKRREDRKQYGSGDPELLKHSATQRAP